MWAAKLAIEQASCTNSLILGVTCATWMHVLMCVDWKIFIDKMFSAVQQRTNITCAENRIHYTTLQTVEQY